MEFYDVVGHVLELLQRQKRVSYRALKRQFSIDDDDIEEGYAALAALVQN